MSLSTPCDSQQRAAGCLFGMAFGDALAAPTEFISSISAILAQFPPAGPQELVDGPEHSARVTDDTQMALAVGKALLATPQPYQPADLEAALRSTFIEWSNSPDNNRAPGITCMNACAQLARGHVWQDATVLHSKGCGANMRVAPVGLLPSTMVTETTRAAIAQFQAALTHGHPTGLVVADLTAQTITALRSGVTPDRILIHLQAYARGQRTVYHSEWLGSLWRRAGASKPEEFIVRGWDECLQALDRVRMALKIGPLDLTDDPCAYTGAAWIAEEALATGLYCFLLYPDDPVAAVRRAAVTTGDSDSIACLTGAFAGAYHGLSAWPQGWIECIEYRDQLEQQASSPQFTCGL